MEAQIEQSSYPTSPSAPRQGSEKINSPHLLRILTENKKKQKIDAKLQNEEQFGKGNTQALVMLDAQSRDKPSESEQARLDSSDRLQILKISQKSPLEQDSVKKENSRTAMANMREASGDNEAIPNDWVAPNALFTKPDMLILRSLSNEELRSMQSFEIYNEHGSVRFEGTVDLADVDLQNEVFISHRSVFATLSRLLCTQTKQSLR